MFSFRNRGPIYFGVIILSIVVPAFLFYMIQLPCQLGINIPGLAPHFCAYLPELFKLEPWTDGIIAKGMNAIRLTVVPLGSGSLCGWLAIKYAEAKIEERKKKM